MTQKAVMLLTGELLKHGEDWDNPRFGSLFNRLQNEVKTPGSVIRYLRHYGEIDGQAEIRFFGVTADTKDNIPDGMVTLEIGENRYRVYKPTDTGITAVWEAGLSWDWLDLSNPEYPVGEFRTKVPAGHMPNEEVKDIHFVLSGFSYTERGKSADDDVKLAGYDPTWLEKYEEMKEWLQENLSPDIARRIEHYGSTAIPGMPAKPVIDILLEIPSFGKARQALIPFFNKPECEYWWYNGHMTFIIRDRFMGTRTHHIHAAPAGHHVWEGLVFRDYLRNHHEDAQKYAELKHKLAESNASDRETYTDLKAEFVREITEKALKSERKPPEEMGDFFTARLDIYEEHMLTESGKAAYHKLAELVPSDTKILLDLGCGTGLELDYIFKLLPEIEVTGIDMTQSMLDRLLQKHPDKNMRLICTSYLDTFLGEHRYETAISFMTMHHLLWDVKVRMYRKIHKALKPEGRYIECDFMMGTQAEENEYFQRYLELRRDFAVPEDELVHIDIPFTVENQIAMLKEAGFSSVTLEFQEMNAVILTALK